MNKEEFDRLFDEAFEEAVKSMPDSYPPDYRESWKKVKKRRAQIEKRRFIRKAIRNISVIAVSMLLGAIIFGNTPVTRAFNPYYQTIKEFPGQVVSFFFGNRNTTEEGAKTLPPSMDRGNTEDINLSQEVIVVTIEEAKEKLNFPTPSFDHIPEGFQLNKTELFMNPNEEKAKEVIFTFTNRSEIFRATLTQLGTNTSIGSGANKAQVDVVQLKFGQGYLAVSSDGSSKLEFLKGDIHVSILGNLSPEELILFADNM